jgi:predicted nucleic acid-binding protein
VQLYELLPLQLTLLSRILFLLFYVSFHQSAEKSTLLKLVHTFNIYAYDAYVLDCAKQYQTPLLSLDKKMIDIAKKLQIITLEVSL